MEYVYKNLPYIPKKVSICDAQIDTIICSDNSVRFVFTKGFSVIFDGKSEKCSYGYIELSDCEADEFECYIIHRDPSPVGAQINGEPISLAELSNMLEQEDSKVEIFLELYDFNFLYWRGVLLPHKAQGLSDHVIIEASGRFAMTYWWE